MKLGVFTVSIPEWQPEEALEKLSKMGYQGVEWRITADDGDRAKPSFWSGNRCGMTSEELLARADSLKAAAKRWNMAMPSLGTYMDCDDLPAVETAMRAAVAIGAASLRVGPGYFNTKAGADPYPVQLERAQARYAHVARLAAKYGVRALIETHMHQIAPSTMAAAAVLKGLDPRHVGIMWDPGNQVMEGREKTAMALQIAGNLLAEVHVKNMRFDPGKTDDGRFVMYPASAPVDAGVVDWPSLIPELKAAGYDGWLFFEDFCTERPMEERLRHNLEFFRKIV
jgi:sugar phosphate isomerase/epimerase